MINGSLKIQIILDRSDVEKILTNVLHLNEYL